LASRSEAAVPGDPGTGGRRGPVAPGTARARRDGDLPLGGPREGSKRGRPGRRALRRVRGGRADGRGGRPRVPFVAREERAGRPRMSECGVLDGLHARAYDACIPLHVSLELTLRCNIRCTHCYNFDRDQPRSGSGSELSMEEIRPLLDDLRRSGTLFLSLTGGEAMVHPRFWEIADEAAARGFAVTVLSNGTLLTEQACDRLAGYSNLWGVSLSLYGARADTHDGVTQVPGSYERTMAGARRLARRGARVGLKFVVMKANAPET